MSDYKEENGYPIAKKYIEHEKFASSMKHTINETKYEWSRRKTFVLYFCSIPFIAGLLVYWTMNAYTMVGTVSLLVGGIILFKIVEAYMREVCAHIRLHRFLSH